jgi:hypothetical protein
VVVGLWWDFGGTLVGLSWDNSILKNNVLSLFLGLSWDFRGTFVGLSWEFLGVFWVVFGWFFSIASILKKKGSYPLCFLSLRELKMIKKGNYPQFR